MTTNLWVEQYWYDHKLVWSPEEFGGVDMLHVPSTHIWLPDIVLYNNADGNFEVTLATKATLYHSGLVEWKPPAIYHSSCEMDVEYFPFDEQTCVMKFGSWTYDGFQVYDIGLVEWKPPAIYHSSCEMDVEYFPFDEQTCVMKFGSWTYDGFQVDLRHQDDKMPLTGHKTATTSKEELESKAPDIVEIGIDLKEFYKSVEWDILGVPAARNVKFYTCCDEPYLDITFNITMRRKTLFYTVNLIIPCMGISFLTVLVFYLPSDSGEKVSLSISILLSLTVFFLLLAEIIPPTSLVVPLLGKFVLFTMILDTFRTPCNGYEFPLIPTHTPPHSFNSLSRINLSRCPEVTRALEGIKYIAAITQSEEESNKAKEDWKFVAMVMDRLFLWIFTVAVLVGTAGIILQAPTLYDTRPAIDEELSEIEITQIKPDIPIDYPTAEIDSII
ncbi:acetylcholine receptor subunit alpha-like [Eurytemora carolleeae]|uniref:acetylcholine receptor subunit alpha-like n=1 Tax=Eurytemora carolleeae TaxID=1294199 RepID=UPI000C78AE02|nr:acetylcholine receptor subunit alpha-like [Eurytemora carolleeae]|eukprot:XP_023326790.1 acetylcholine receptor subunit alpha-like [Eurytemora affinis]